MVVCPKTLFIGENTGIYPDAYICLTTHWAGLTYHPQIKIGNDIYIGRHVYLSAIDLIEIGDGCVLSEYVYITDHMHGFHPKHGPIMEQPLQSRGPVHMGRNCFLGFRVSIMPGVTLGDHCVVGANSVVTRSFPAYSMIAGCPAKMIKTFSFETETWEALASIAADVSIQQ
jgi:acetyltransferase-like isoleucine patch superfamily enzyme